MALTLVRCKVLRPFAWLGRVAGCGERLRMHPEDFEHWSASGHVARIDEAPAVLVLAPDRWTTPVER